MTEQDSPPGWRSNPSAWPRRLPAFVLALIGLGIASYLAFFQVGVFAEVWEPFFGNGSRLLLKQSSIAHLLPIPDAALGAFAYLVDAILDFSGMRFAADGAVAGAPLLRRRFFARNYLHFAGHSSTDAVRRLSHSLSRLRRLFGPDGNCCDIRSYCNASASQAGKNGRRSLWQA